MAKQAFFLLTCLNLTIAGCGIFNPKSSDDSSTLSPEEEKFRNPIKNEDPESSTAIVAKNSSTYFLNDDSLDLAALTSKGDEFADVESDIIEAKEEGVVSLKEGEKTRREFKIENFPIEITVSGKKIDFKNELIEFGLVSKDFIGTVDVKVKNTVGRRLTGKFVFSGPNPEAFAVKNNKEIDLGPDEVGDFTLVFNAKNIGFSKGNLGFQASTEKEKFVVFCRLLGIGTFKGVKRNLPLDNFKRSTIPTSFFPIKPENMIRINNTLYVSSTTGIHSRNASNFEETWSRIYTFDVNLRTGLVDLGGKLGVLRQPFTGSANTTLFELSESSPFVLKELYSESINSMHIVGHSKDSIYIASCDANGSACATVKTVKNKAVVQTIAPVESTQGIPDQNRTFPIGIFNNYLLSRTPIWEQISPGFFGQSHKLNFFDLSNESSAWTREDLNTILPASQGIQTADVYQAGNDLYFVNSLQKTAEPPEFYSKKVFVRTEKKSGKTWKNVSGANEMVGFTSRNWTADDAIQVFVAGSMLFLKIDKLNLNEPSLRRFFAFNGDSRNPKWHDMGPQIMSAIPIGMSSINCTANFASSDGKFYLSYVHVNGSPNPDRCETIVID
jgi:hypothetical protein